MTADDQSALPKAFLWRRLHSLTGLFLVLFLIEHLLTNSQAALLPGEDGKGFIQGVNFIHSLPYLPAIEIFLLGVPFLIHIVWGVQYLRTAKLNSLPNDGSRPSLGEYGRNQAYTWQRITSWILLVGTIAHVVHMRIIEYPAHARDETGDLYVTRLEFDPGLHTLSDRLDVDLYDHSAIESEKNDLQVNGGQTSDPIKQQRLHQKEERLAALQHKSLTDNQVMAVSDDFGTATLLVVRNTFKSPLMIGLYTVFVLSAGFHASNGLWTFLITWGINLSPAAQKRALTFSRLFTGLLLGLGLVAIWGTYWINLRH